ncbi:MAG TPA: RDD family protein [Actinomycetota bacterium]
MPPSPQATWAPPPPPQPAQRYASFWIRVAATLIDGLVFLPLSIPFLIAVWNRMSTEVDRSISTGRHIDTTRYVGRYAGWAFAIAAATYAYQALMVRYLGGTLGKLAVGIRVRTADGNVPGWREALLRPILQLIVSFGSFVPGAGLITLLDDLWMLWDRQKQTLHDKVAGTIVVYH